MIDNEDIQTLQTAVNAIMRTIKVRETALQAAHQDLKLQPIDIHSLKFIKSHPGVRLRDLAGDLGVATTTASSAVDRLVRRQLLARTRPEDNRRALALRLTSQGQSAIQTLEDEEHKTMALMLAALPAQERPAFLAAMDKIARHLENSVE